jgi:hypothetical protein
MAHRTLAAPRRWRCHPHDGKPLGGLRCGRRDAGKNDAPSELETAVDTKSVAGDPARIIGGQEGVRVS